MVIVAAGKEIRAREAGIGKVAAIRSAPDRSNHRFNTDSTHGIAGPVNQIHMFGESIFQIVISVFYDRHCSIITVFGIQKCTAGSKEIFSGFKFSPVMIPDDIVHHCGFHRTMHSIEMIEPFIVFRMFRAIRFGEQSVQLESDSEGVAHLVFCAARVDASSVDLHPC